jgi:hypothetical protein
LSLRPPTAAAPPPQSPARQKLAAAIDNLTELQSRIAALEEAHQRTYRAVNEAHAAHEAAVAGIDAALHAASDHAVAAILHPDTAGQPPVSVAAARATAQAAADALATAEQVRDKLRAEAKTLPDALPLREMARDDAARQVLREEGGPAIAALFARIDAAYREVLDCGLALIALQRLDVVIDRGPDAYPRAMEFCSVFRNGFAEWIMSSTPAASPTAAAWRAAYEALRLDATAPVPVLP